MPQRQNGRSIRGYARNIEIPIIHKRKGVEMSLTFQTELFSAARVTSFFNEMLPLGAASYAETHDKDDFNPDLTALGMGWQMGSIQVYTARDNGALVGYLLVMVTKASLWANVADASALSFYMKPDYRGNGKKLIEHALAEVKLQGAIGIGFTADVGTRYERYLPMIGARLTAQSYILEVLK